MRKGIPQPDHSCTTAAGGAPLAEGCKSLCENWFLRNEVERIDRVFALEGRFQNRPTLPAPGKTGKLHSIAERRLTSSRSLSPRGLITAQNKSSYVPSYFRLRSPGDPATRESYSAAIVSQLHPSER